jgi:hypothetical protein
MMGFPGVDSVRVKVFRVISHLLDALHEPLFGFMQNRQRSTTTATEVGERVDGAAEVKHKTCIKFDASFMPKDKTKSLKWHYVRPQ